MPQIHTPENPSLRETGTALADAVADRASETIAEAQSALKGGIESLQNGACQAKVRAEANIRKNPWKAVLIAFGAGCLFSLLCRRH